MNLTVLCSEIYDYFYLRIYNKQAPYSRDEKSIKLIDKCIERLFTRYESIGPHFLWFYISYQFNRFSVVNFKLKGHYTNITTTNIFADTPLKKFLERDVQFDDITLKAGWYQMYQISKIDFTARTKISLENGGQVINEQDKQTSIQQYKSIVKASAIRLDIPLELCRDYTDLCTPQDPACQQCKQQQECKDLLKKMYPYLYNIKILMK